MNELIAILNAFGITTDQAQLFIAGLVLYRIGRYLRSFESDYQSALGQLQTKKKWEGHEWNPPYCDDQMFDE